MEQEIIKKRVIGIDISLDYRPLFNEYWVSPSQNEKPKYSEKVEGSCYW